MLTPNATDSLDKPQFLNSYPLPLNEKGAKRNIDKLRGVFGKKQFKNKSLPGASWR